MNIGFQKYISLILVCLISFSQSFAAGPLADDQQDLAKLADGFAVAMVKKDKDWMNAKLTSTCVMFVPSGETLDKGLAIHAFSGGVYDIKKSSVTKRSFMVSGTEAGGSADYTVEGSGKINGEIIDVGGTYTLSLKFRKSDQGWQISEILINEN